MSILNSIFTLFLLLVSSFFTTFHFMLLKIRDFIFTMFVCLCSLLSFLHCSLLCCTSCTSLPFYVVGLSVFFGCFFFFFFWCASAYILEVVDLAASTKDVCHMLGTIMAGVMLCSICTLLCLSCQLGTIFFMCFDNILVSILIFLSHQSLCSLSSLLT